MGCPDDADLPEKESIPIETQDDADRLWDALYEQRPFQSLLSVQSLTYVEMRIATLEKLQAQLLSVLDTQGINIPYSPHVQMDTKRSGLSGINGTHSDGETDSVVRTLEV
jgi:hypothetical protein